MAGTVVETRRPNFKGEKRQVERQFLCTGDAAAGTVPNKTIKGMEGWYVENITTWPGTGGAQPSAYTVGLQDTGLNDLAIIDLPARSTTLTQSEIGSVTIGQFPKVRGDLTLIVGDLGNSGQATINILFTAEI
jgi:hypothetical protein